MGFDGVFRRSCPLNSSIQDCVWSAQPWHAVGQAAAPSASSMILRMVRAQRPHWALQPRQP
jgi:hypothetical protein